MMFLVTKAESLTDLFQTENEYRGFLCYWATVSVLDVFGCCPYCNSQVCSYHGNETGGFVKQGSGPGREVQAQTIQGRGSSGKSGKCEASGKETRIRQSTSGKESLRSLSPAPSGA